MVGEDKQWPARGDATFDAHQKLKDTLLSDRSYEGYEDEAELLERMKRNLTVMRDRFQNQHTKKVPLPWSTGLKGERQPTISKSRQKRKRAVDEAARTIPVEAPSMFGRDSKRRKMDTQDTIDESIKLSRKEEHTLLLEHGNKHEATKQGQKRKRDSADSADSYAVEIAKLEDGRGGETKRRKLNPSNDGQDYIKQAAQWCDEYRLREKSEAPELPKDPLSVREEPPRRPASLFEIILRRLHERKELGQERAHSEAGQQVRNLPSPTSAPHCAETSGGSNMPLSVPKNARHSTTGTAKLPTQPEVLTTQMKNQFEKDERKKRLRMWKKGDISKNFRRYFGIDSNDDTILMKDLVSSYRYKREQRPVDWKLGGSPTASGMGYEVMARALLDVRLSELPLFRVQTLTHCAYQGPQISLKYLTLPPKAATIDNWRQPKPLTGESARHRAFTKHIEESKLRQAAGKLWKSAPKDSPLPGITAWKGSESMGMVGLGATSSTKQFPGLSTGVPSPSVRHH